MNDDSNLIEANLSDLLTELKAQSGVGRQFPVERLAFDGLIEQLREWIEEANEAGLAYESLVATLSSYSFQITGPTAVKLLEVGLLMGFKTTLPEDIRFDRRQQP